MKRQYVFRIPGAPVRVFKTEEEGRQPLDTYMENKLKYRITLESQIDDQEIINHPITAVFKFFLPHNAKYRQHKVSIVKLFEFINFVAEGTVYKKEHLLYDVKLHKEYSDDPHTEIVIRPIKNVKGGTNEAKK